MPTLAGPDGTRKKIYLASVECATAAQGFENDDLGLFLDTTITSGGSSGGHGISFQ